MKKIVSWIKLYYMNFFISNDSIGMYDIESEDTLLSELGCNTLDIDLISADMTLASSCPPI